MCAAAAVVVGVDSDFLIQVDFYRHLTFENDSEKNALLIIIYSFLSVKNRISSNFGHRAYTKKKIKENNMSSGGNGIYDNHLHLFVDVLTYKRVFEIIKNRSFSFENFLNTKTKFH